MIVVVALSSPGKQPGQGQLAKDVCHAIKSKLPGTHEEPGENHGDEPSALGLLGFMRHGVFGLSYRL